MVCQACGGIGWRYASPVELVALVTGVEGKEKYLLQAGLVSPGDLVLGLSPFEPPERSLSDFDLVRLTWDAGSPHEGDVIRRGTAGFDVLAYEPKRIVSISQVADPLTGVVTEYVEGTDFSVSGRRLTWLAGGSKPLSGTTYAVAYTAVFDWIVFVAPLQRFERGVHLGQRAVLRKRHLAIPGG